MTYLFERGGKRDKRTQVARDTTMVASQTAVDAERQLAFQTGQAFINVLLAKSTLDLARENLKNFSQRRRRQPGAPARRRPGGRRLLQDLAAEAAVRARPLGGARWRWCRRRRRCARTSAYESLTDDFDVDGDLDYRKFTVTLDDLKRDALAARPDLLAAQTGVKLAQAHAGARVRNRARDITGGVEYDRAGSLNAHRLQHLRRICRSTIATRATSRTAKIAIRKPSETQKPHAQHGADRRRQRVSPRSRPARKSSSLYQSGYLDQAQQSLDITTYVYQQGSGTLLDLLDAERTYRSTQLAYRQALAAYMTSVQQINFAVGKQVLQ